MIKMYDEVKVKSNGAIGIVVDIDSKGMVTVEGHKNETTSGSVYGDDFPLYYVKSSELVKLDTEDKSFVKKVANFTL